MAALTGITVVTDGKPSGTVGLSQSEADRLLEKNGKNAIPEDIEPWYIMLGKQFLGPMPFTIELATVLAAVAESWNDFAIILLMLLCNAGIGYHEEHKSTKAMRELANQLAPTVSVERDGKFKQLKVEDLVVGDFIFVRGGSKVPADCHWVKGDTLLLDNSALTGESRLLKRPLKDAKIIKAGRSAATADEDPHAEYVILHDGEEQPGVRTDQLAAANPATPLAEGMTVNQVDCLSGGTIKQGEAYCIVDRIGMDTEIGKASANNPAPGKGEFQKKIERAAGVYIVIALFFAIIMLIDETAVRGEHTKSEILLPILALVISAVPVALPMVITVTLAVGAYKMSQEGAIVTNLGALQEMASMDLLCSDKTGTLTTAQMTVYPNKIWINDKAKGGKVTADEVLMLATLCSNRDNVDDPIDRAVIQAWDAEHPDGAGEKIVAGYQEDEFVGFNPLIKRTLATITTPDGEQIIIAKGLLDKVMDTEGDEAELQWVVKDFAEVSPAARSADEELSKDAFKTIAVSVKRGSGEFELYGVLPMRDPPRSDTAETIKNIRNASIGVKMITGDHLNIAKKTSAQINLGTNIYAHDDLWPASAARDQLIADADGFAKVTPNDKLEVVHICQTTFKHTVGMTGDGVNDAPALKRANIGIAVHGATDAARASADIVLTKAGLSVIYSAVLESRRIFKRIEAYVIYRLACTVLMVLVLFTLQVALNVHIPAFLIVLLALFCDLSVIPISSDLAQPSATPTRPDMVRMLVISSVLGIMLAASTMLVYIWLIIGRYGARDYPLIMPASLDVNTHGACVDTYAEVTLRSGGTGPLHAQLYCEIEVILYWQLSIACALLIFQTRTPGLFFLSRPGIPLVVLGVIFQGIVLILVLVKNEIVEVTPDTDVVFSVLGFTVAYAIGLDFFKMWLYAQFDHKRAETATQSTIGRIGDHAKTKPNTKVPTRNHFGVTMWLSHIFHINFANYLPHEYGRATQTAMAKVEDEAPAIDRRAPAPRKSYLAAIGQAKEKSGMPALARTLSRKDSRKIISTTEV